MVSLKDHTLCGLTKIPLRVPVSPIKQLALPRLGFRVYLGLELYGEGHFVVDCDSHVDLAQQRVHVLCTSVGHARLLERCVYETVSRPWLVLIHGLNTLVYYVLVLCTWLSELLEQTRFHIRGWYT